MLAHRPPREFAYGVFSCCLCYLFIIFFIRGEFEGGEGSGVEVPDWQGGLREGRGAVLAQHPRREFCGSVVSL